MLDLTSKNKTDWDCLQVDCKQRTLNFYYPLLRNSLGLFAVSLFHFITTFQIVFYLSLMIFITLLYWKVLKTALSRPWKTNVLPLPCTVGSCYFELGAKNFKDSYQGRSRQRSRRTCSLPPPTNTTEHIYMWNNSHWKLLENLLYNQSCKKDPHVTNQYEKKRKENSFGMGLVPLRGRWRRKGSLALETTFAHWDVHQERESERDLESTHEGYACALTC